MGSVARNITRRARNLREVVRGPKHPRWLLGKKSWEVHELPEKPGQHNRRGCPKVRLHRVQKQSQFNWHRGVARIQRWAHRPQKDQRQRPRYQSQNWNRPKNAQVVVRQNNKEYVSGPKAVQRQLAWEFPDGRGWQSNAKSIALSIAAWLGPGVRVWEQTHWWYGLE